MLQQRQAECSQRMGRLCRVCRNLLCLPEKFDSTSERYHWQRCLGPPAHCKVLQTCPRYKWNHDSRSTSSLTDCDVIGQTHATFPLAFGFDLSRDVYVTSLIFLSWNNWPQCFVTRLTDFNSALKNTWLHFIFDMLCLFCFLSENTI